MRTVQCRSLTKITLKKFTRQLDPIAAKYISGTDPVEDGFLLYAGFMDGALYVLDNIKDFYP